MARKPIKGYVYIRKPNRGHAGGGDGGDPSDQPLDAKGEPLLRDLRHEDTYLKSVDHNTARSNRERTSGVASDGTDANNGGGLASNTFAIGRKAVTTFIALGLLAVVASEGYAIYDASQSDAEDYFAFEWTSKYDKENRIFSVSSPLFVDNPGMIQKEANVAVTISMACGENIAISQHDFDYTFGEDVTLEFVADVPQPMADCIEQQNEFTVDLTGKIGLIVLGFEAAETDLPEMGFECTKDGQEGDETAESVDHHSCRSN
ncbi:MAG: Uncharacterised protein [Candidatus Poseidoniaceae archaeon]|nr:MAG: Uncharacterised protein [Candidatus Poseidoniaceae archaeon]